MTRSPMCLIEYLGAGLLVRADMPHAVVCEQLNNYEVCLQLVLIFRGLVN
jgi:hypothetical protein